MKTTLYVNAGALTTLLLMAERYGGIGHSAYTSRGVPLCPVGMLEATLPRFQGASHDTDLSFVFRSPEGWTHNIPAVSDQLFTANELANKTFRISGEEWLTRLSKKYHVVIEDLPPTWGDE